jgi:hypothetical protein
VDLVVAAVTVKDGFGAAWASCGAMSFFAVDQVQQTLAALAAAVATPAYERAKQETQWFLFVLMMTLVLQLNAYR